MNICLPGGGQIGVKRAVVKLGTKQITDVETINHENIRNLVAELIELRKKGVELVLTVSGAIGLGVHELFGTKDALDKLTLSQKQALAGVGQVRLMELFKAEFAKYGVRVGQVLLTHFIFDNRSAYLNARNTLNTMLEMGVIPIINENDSVATEEIKVGQNDSLGAYVSLLVSADLYVMLTDIDGLYKNYRTSEQELIPVVDNVSKVMRFAGKQEEKFSKGGMITKLEAARVTTVSGVPAVIANGFGHQTLLKVFDNLSAGTLFLPSQKGLNRKKRWITGKRSKGMIVVDRGASQAVMKHKSLLPSGVVRVIGNFRHGDTVQIAGDDLVEIALGLTNFSSEEISRIAGRQASEVENILGKGHKQTAVVHIDNMVIFEEE